MSVVEMLGKSERGTGKGYKVDWLDERVVGSNTLTINSQRKKRDAHRCWRA